MRTARIINSNVGINQPRFAIVPANAKRTALRVQWSAVNTAVPLYISFSPNGDEFDMRANGIGSASSRSSLIEFLGDGCPHCAVWLRGGAGGGGIVSIMEVTE